MVYGFRDPPIALRLLAALLLARRPREQTTELIIGKAREMPHLGSVTKNYRDYLLPICFSSFSQCSTSFSYFSVAMPCSGRQRLNGCSFVALPY